MPHLESNCLPYRNSFNPVGAELTTSSIGEQREHVDLLDLLLKRLEIAYLISDASQFNLTYKAEDGQVMGIKTDNDLQVAVGWHYRHKGLYADQCNDTGRLASHSGDPYLHVLSPV